MQDATLHAAVDFTGTGGVIKPAPRATESRRESVNPSVGRVSEEQILAWLADNDRDDEGA